MLDFCILQFRRSNGSSGMRSALRITPAAGTAPRRARAAPSASGRARAPNARTTIRPVGVGDSTISRSAAVTSSSSGSSARCCGRHQVELDHAAAGGAVVDRVIGDAVARIERHRRIGRADRHAQLERAVGEIVAADRGGEGRIHERQHGVVRASAAGSGTMLLTGADRGEARDRRPASRCAAAAARSPRCTMPPSSSAAEQPEEPADHGQPPALTAGIGASRGRCASRRRPACRRGAAPAM